MSKKIFFALILAVLVSLSYSRISSDTFEPETDEESSPSKRQTQDFLTSAEIEERRTNIKEQLRQLDHHRQKRFDSDRRCCERSISVDDDGSACCRRLKTRPCPFTESDRCRVPVRCPAVETPQDPPPPRKPCIQYKPVRKTERKLVTVTHSPRVYNDIEQQRLTQLEKEIRLYRQVEEQRLKNLEDQKRVELENSLRREHDDEEARLDENHRSRRQSLEEEIARKRREEQTLRENLEFELHNERQSERALRKQRHDDRRNRLETDLLEQRRLFLERLDADEAQRRRQFEDELNTLKNLLSGAHQEEFVFDHLEYVPVNAPEPENEPVPQPVRQPSNPTIERCCTRCAAQSCNNGCPEEDTECPLRKKRCDRCRCNHSFISCNLDD